MHQLDLILHWLHAHHLWGAFHVLTFDVINQGRKLWTTFKSFASTMATATARPS